MVQMVGESRHVSLPRLTSRTGTLQFCPSHLPKSENYSLDVLCIQKGHSKTHSAAIIDTDRPFQTGLYLCLSTMGLRRKPIMGMVILRRPHITREVPSSRP